MSVPTDPAALFSSFNVSAGIGMQSAAPTTGIANEMLALHMRELVGLTRELVRIGSEQLDIARRAEERYQKRHHMQQEELDRWFQEHRGLRGRCGGVEETLRSVLGRAITELVDYVEENADNLVDSDFVRSEMADRFGPMLNHVSAMHGMLKRLSLADPSSVESQAEVPE